jgi:hypothetical protein
MMLRFLGQRADLVRERQGGGKVRKRKRFLEVMVFDDGPAGGWNVHALIVALLTSLHGN